jgi:hypothetical protein
MANQIKPLMGAVSQLLQSGNEEDAKKGAEVLADARRKIYSILAESSTDGEVKAD